MNCADFQAGLQASLDGTLSTDAGEWDRHLASCQGCRELSVAAGRLRNGLRRLEPPTPPLGLANQIVSHALAARRTRLRRRVLAVTALAAGLLVAATLYVLLPQSNVPSVPGNDNVVQVPPVSQPIASLRDSVAEAGSALAELTQRAADDTFGQTRSLVSGTVKAASFDENRVLQDTLDPPARSLREAGQTVTMGLEPVTQSARRAFDLFLRDLPPLSANKTGL
jgi:hypothetical protein